MAGPLDGYGQAGANDDQAAVYFLHQNGLIPPDFPDGSDSISRMDQTIFPRWISQNLSDSLLLEIHPMLINQPQTCLRGSLE